MAGSSSPSSSSSSEQQQQAPTNLANLADTLQAASAVARADVTDFLAEHPTVRGQVSSLLRELSEVHVTARLAAAQAGPLDRGESPLPAAVVCALADVVRAAAQLMSEVEDALKDDGGAALERRVSEASLRQREQNHGAAWLEHTTDCLGSLGRLVKTSRMAMSLGVDVMLSAANAPPPDEANGDLPAYSSSQMLSEAISLCDMLQHDAESDDGRVLTQRPVLVKFAKTVREYMDQSGGGGSRRGSAWTTGTNRNGNGNSNGNGLEEYDLQGRRTTVSSMHSQFHDDVSPTDTTANTLPETEAPDYHAIGITSPAPLRISLKHLAKKDLSPSHEIVEIAYAPRLAVPGVAVSTLQAPTRFFDTRANQVSILSNQHGAHMTFSRDGRSWAYVCEEEPRDLNPWGHDADNFRRPVVYVGDYLNGRRAPQVRRPGVRPLCFSRDGSKLAMAVAGPGAGARGRLAVVDLKAGPTPDKAALVVACHADAVTHAAFTPDGSKIVSLGRDGVLRLTETSTRKSVAKFDTDSWRRPVFLGIVPGGDVVVSICGDTVYHWNTTTSAIESYSLASRRTREGWPIAASPDCRFLCCRTDDGADIGDLHSGRILYTIQFQRGFLTAAAFSHDGKYLFLGKAASWMGMRSTVSTLDVWELGF